MCAALCLAAALPQQPVLEPVCAKANPSSTQVPIVIHTTKEYRTTMFQAARVIHREVFKPNMHYNGKVALPWKHSTAYTQLAGSLIAASCIGIKFQRCTCHHWQQLR